MKVGFTGTQAGMTIRQQMAVESFLLAFSVTEFHHGDCVGADEQAQRIAHGLGIRTVCHPPELERKRAWTTNDETRQPFPYLIRNRHIVNEVELLIATPKEVEEQLRSGTWSTVRYACRINRRVLLIRPDGRIR